MGQFRPFPNFFHHLNIGHLLNHENITSSFDRGNYNISSMYSIMRFNDQGTVYSIRIQERTSRTEIHPCYKVLIVRPHRTLAFIYRESINAQLLPLSQTTDSDKQLYLSVKFISHHFNVFQNLDSTEFFSVIVQPHCDLTTHPANMPQSAWTGVGVTKTPFVNFSVSKIFHLAKIPVKFFEWHSDLTGVTAPERGIYELMCVFIMLKNSQK